jgi:hypothetical protein
MPSTKPLVLLGALAAVMTARSTDASGCPGADMALCSVAGLPEPADASSTRSAGQLVDGYLEYIDTLKDRSDVSLERLQSAVGVQLRQGDSGSSDVTAIYPEGDSVTLSFWDEGSAEWRTAALDLYDGRGPDERPPHCRLPFDSLRGRLLRVGYDDMQEWGELGRTGTWLFFKDDVWLQVSTLPSTTNNSDRACAWTIYARGKFGPRSESK